MMADEPAVQTPQVEFREGGAIPAKQLACLAAALGQPAVAVEPAQLLDSMLVVSAWDGARLVGLARLVGDGRTLALLQHVGVHPAYRRRGIGSALVARCLARCGTAEVFVLPGGPA